MPGVWRMKEGRWPDEPYLFLADGWHRGDDGTWRVTPRARRRRDFLSGRVHDVRRQGPNLTPTDLDAPRGSARGEIAHYLPSPAVCPFCGTPQLLDPTALGVGSRRFGSPEPGRHYAHPEGRQD
jgi:hypothetical protein